jgi:methenyltetrahydrofolate cyclohydrolase
VTAPRRVVAGEQVDALLEALASGSTEPGSGAFAALSAASGAALVTAVAQHTLRRLDAGDATRIRLVEIADEADDARPVLLALADRHAAVQHELTQAARMPQDTDSERTARLVELQSVLEGTVDAHLELARRSVLLAGLAEEAAISSDTNAAADGLAAVAALHAAAIASLANVELNAFAIADPVRRDELAETCAALGERAARMLEDARGAFATSVHPN